MKLTLCLIGLNLVHILISFFFKIHINIMTDLLKSLLGNGSVNTPRPTCTQQYDIHL
jgi:hypothetical protein